MAPATIQLVLGVMEVLLRVAGLLMAVTAIFLFSLHSFAARATRVPARETEQSLALGLAVPRPSPFILRSTRNVRETRFDSQPGVAPRRAA
jgi:hypothetical protein